MWDLKEGTWTPADFAPATFGQFRWPQGLMPKMADQLNRISIVRTGMAWAAVHPLAQKWAQIARKKPLQQAKRHHDDALTGNEQ